MEILSSYNGEKSDGLEKAGDILEKVIHYDPPLESEKQRVPFIVKSIHIKDIDCKGEREVIEKQ